MMGHLENIAAKIIVATTERVDGNYRQPHTVKNMRAMLVRQSANRCVDRRTRCPCHS